MTRRVTPRPTHPALTRFAINERAFLGLLSAKARRRRTKKASRFMRTVNKELTLLGNRLMKNALNGVIAACLVFTIVWSVPKLLFTFFPPLDSARAETVQGDFTLHVDQAQLEEKSADTSAASAPTEPQTPAVYEPPFNENLPEGDWLMIPRIGVRSTLQQTENFEDALTTGLWWVPDFGVPGDLRTPMIIAGHRFGFKWWWEDDYWKYHSFYLLPRLEEGDTVEIIAGQRKYVYEIYGGDEGEEITDYQADLILYTCKYLDSTIRIFRYARLVMGEGV